MHSNQSSGIDPSSETSKAEGAKVIRDAMLELSSRYMEFPDGNDDAIDVPKRVTVTPGQSRPCTTHHPLT